VTGDDAFGFAPPPFKPAEALIQLQRTLRGLAGLAERGGQFDWKGQRVLELLATDAAIATRLARRPAQRPEWESRMLNNGADVRKFADDVKQRLARWRDADD
jgi:hypothetical protein